MALHTFSAILLLSLHLYLVTPDTIPCPFAPVDCTCIQTVLPSETEFQSAHCTPKSGVIPAFTGFGIYAIIDRLVLTFSAYSIPPRAFLAFKSIGLLSLQQIDTSKPVQQYWETHAFVGPLLKGFQVSNLAGVLPPPPPVVELGDYVEKLVFDNCHVPVNLTANGFSTFKKVDTLIISNTPVSKIDDQAFVGIGDTLQELRLTNTGITTFPTTALKSLTSLVRLDLSDNNMQKFTSDDFAPLQALELLILDGNNIGAAIDIGAFAKLPQAINGVSLARAGPPLGYVPSVLINQAPQIFTLSLAQDGIGAIRRGDFPEGNQIHWLDMSGNPISSIDNGALGSLTHLVSLQMNGHKLVSFDLASLSGISSGLETIELTGSDTLTELLISDLSLVPSGLAQVFAANSSNLQYVDPKYDTFLNSAFERVLDISGSTLNCTSDIAWMARNYFCSPYTIDLDDSTCTDKNQGSVSDYLKQLVPNPCSGRRATVRGQ